MKTASVLSVTAIVILTCLVIIAEGVDLRQKKLAVLYKAVDLNRYTYDYSEFSVDKTNIILLGDSRIAHWQGNWPSSTAVVNTGISGSSSVQALKRLDAHVINAKPDWVIVQVGVNDIVASRMQFGESRQNTIQNIVDSIMQISAQLIEHDINTIVMNIPPSIKPDIARRVFWQGDLSSTSQRVNAALIDQLPAEVIFYDTIARFKDPTQQWRKEYRSEPLHWSQLAYQKLTADMLDIIQSAIAK